MDNRYGRGQVLAVASTIRKVVPRTTSAQLWKVESETVQNKFYGVLEKRDGSFLCDCPDFANRGKMCKHIFAVIFYQGKEYSEK